jgi:hypothetical protein
VRGEGPFGRLVLRGVTVINGEGAPPVGPMDVVIEGNRIASLHGVGFPGVPIDAAGRPPTRDGDKVLELDGHYLLPGFIDLHAHFGGDDQGVPAEYPAKLWLAHGITTIREPGSFNGLDWVLEHQHRSERNEIAAPRIIPYVGFGQGVEHPFLTPEEARAWVRDIARRGARGIKFFGAPPAIMRAALDEAGKQGLGSAMHHAQLDVTNWNVLDSARAGLTTMEHWYGLPEALFEDRVIQDIRRTTTMAMSSIVSASRRLWRRPLRVRSGTPCARLIGLGLTLNRPDDYEASRPDAGDERRLAGGLRAPGLWLSSAVARGAWLLLVRLDDRRRNRLEREFPPVDAVSGGLQEPRRPRHPGFGRRLHLEALRIRLHTRNGITAGGGVHPQVPRGYASRRRGAGDG